MIMDSLLYWIKALWKRKLKRDETAAEPTDGLCGFVLIGLFRTPDLSPASRAFDTFLFGVQHGGPLDSWLPSGFSASHFYFRCGP